jgi:hypothetical protein
MSWTVSVCPFDTVVEADDEFGALLEAEKKFDFFGNARAEEIPNTPGPKPSQKAHITWHSLNKTK